MRTQTILIVVACLVALVILTTWLVRKNREWELYKVEHECQRTEETRTILVPSGVTSLPVRQHRWECHDGQEHWH